MKPRAIHQFHAAAQFGDGVSNAMFFTQRILRQAGFNSEIFAVHIGAGVRHRVNDYRSFAPRHDELLLVHYSLGTDEDAWIAQVPAPKVLVYHNITPRHFLPEGSDTWNLIVRGRRSLAHWGASGVFEGAIGLSELSAKALRQFGFARVAVNSLAVDLNHYRRLMRAPDARVVGGPKRLLFVGRVCEHKGQLDVIRALGAIRRRLGAPVLLDLVGAVGSDNYARECRAAAEADGVADAVSWRGHLEEDELCRLYQEADLYVSMSRHEGFGMPLVEAMVFDTPVIALQRGAVGETLGAGGWLLEEADPAGVAEAVYEVLTAPRVRQRILAGQRRRLRNFERVAVVPAFEATLRDFGYETALSAALLREPDLSAPTQWRIEGPCDSSYSLAIVNRELARALDAAGVDVGLINRDNVAEYPVASRFIDEWPKAEGLLARARAAPVDVVLRNQFPPYTDDMCGRLRVLANFAWEESALPADWVEAFNRHLDLVTVTSRFVASALRDSGVFTPIVVVGNGVDHLAGVAADKAPPLPRMPGRLRFLHVSSCFPRKGADVLLEAWGRAFTNDDGVELIIKSFANDHNQIESDLSSFAQLHPRHAPVRLLMEELSESAMAALYESSDVVVAPSRGEGFALPLAEAGWRGKALITTGHGGQTDFCTSETAWLTDFAFARAHSHLDVADSLWLEPDVTSLTEALREAATSPELRAAKGAAARGVIRARYRWAQVAQRTLAAVERVEAATEAPWLPRIGWVSSFNSRCGIATYSEALIHGFPPERLTIFANEDCQPLSPDLPQVLRVWRQGGETLERLEAALLAARLDAVIVQFNFGFFALEHLDRLLSRLVEAGVRVYLMMHSTMDVVWPDRTVTLRDHLATFSRVERVFVHTLADMNRLKAFGLLQNLGFFPHGLPTPVATPPNPREIGEDPLIATFGFMIGNKGYRHLIRALTELRETYPRARLLMLTALYPDDASAREADACRALIAELNLGDAITLETGFLSESEILGRLGAADVVCYPYQQTQESASGSVKLGLSSLVPVAHTPSHIFADVADATFAFADFTVEAIAAGLRRLLSDKALREQMRHAQMRLVETRAWPRLSRRLHDGVAGGRVVAEHI